MQKVFQIAHTLTITWAGHFALVNISDSTVCEE